MRHFHKRASCIGLLVIAICLAPPHPLVAQSRTGALANSQQIDPVRAGDAIEVKVFSDWLPGTVLSFADGKANVEFDRSGHRSTREFALEDMRFPNGEGHWTIWKDSAGKLNVEARYIARDETSVMIRKANGQELTLPISSLSLDLRQQVKKTPITGEENKVDGADPVRVGDRVQVNRYSNWHDGVVRKLFIGQAEVEFEYNGRSDTEKFALDKIRFPNGEGFWREWRDASGQFKVIARYISRTETQVTIRRESGADVTIEIRQLAPAMQRWLRDTPVTGKETVIGGVNPIRVGDKVQVRSGSTWEDGVIVESRAGGALVESDSRKREFELKDIRFPNGEGHWGKWTDDSGSFAVIARYLTRTESHVTLLRENGQVVTVPIERLSSKLRQALDQAVAVTPRPQKVQFAMSPRTSAFLSSAPTFAASSLSNLRPPDPIAFRDGGFGFELTHGDSISAAIATGGPEPWVAVGTFAKERFSGSRMTRLYWTQPSARKMVPGPAFLEDERIVDYSASQGRLITVQVSEGTWEQPRMFCSYRVQVGGGFAQPEAAWDIAEKRNSYGRGASYLARLVGDNQLLLADGNAVSLYDFGSRRIVYTVADLATDHFVLHPAKMCFVVRRKTGGLSLHDTADGQQLAFEPGEGSAGFSHDGRELIRVSNTEVTIFDLQANASPRILPARNLSVTPTSQISKLNDDWIWANSSIYNMEKQLAVWSYAGSGVAIAASKLHGDNMLVAATATSYGKPTFALVGTAKVPHQEAIEEMGKVDAESMLMLKRGSGIRIETSGGPQVREGVLRAIAANGWHEDPGSEVVLIASAQRGDSETVQYQSSRFKFGVGPRNMRPLGGASETVTAAPWLQRVEIKFRDRHAWSNSRGGIPHSLFINEGESVAGKVAEATSPSYSLFEQLQVPAEMLYPQYKYGLGRTSITANGFKDTLFQLEPLTAASRQ